MWHIRIRRREDKQARRSQNRLRKLEQPNRQGKVLHQFAGQHEIECPAVQDA